jgi:hypothetical protein
VLPDVRADCGTIQSRVKPVTPVTDVPDAGPDTPPAQGPRDAVTQGPIVLVGRCLARCREQRRGAGGTGDGQIRRQPKMPQDPADDGAVLDERDEAQATATPRAR